MKQTLLRYMRVYRKILALKFAQRMTHRLDFAVTFFAFILVQFTGPLFMAVVYGAGGSFPGWTFAQVLLLQGAMRIIQGFSFVVFFGILWNLQDRIANGTFDLILIRPLKTLPLLIMDSFDEEDLGQLLGGVLVTIWALHLDGGFYGSIFESTFYFVVGVLFFFALALLSGAATIYFVRTFRVYEFINIMMVFAGYPRTIYTGATSFIFTLLLPIFVIGHYPASALLGFPIEQGIGAVLSVAVLLIISVFTWKLSMRYYTSAGG